MDFPLKGTHVLFNPRQPAHEVSDVTGRLESLAGIQDHFWLATSGSSAQNPGELKWVALSMKSVRAAALAVNRHLEAASSDIWIHALPFFHVGGLGILARAHINGAQWVDGLLIQADGFRQWDCRAFYEKASESKATLSALVPTQVYDLVQAGLKSPPSLRAIVVGGAALNEELYARARALGWKLLPSYGLTECGAQVATACLSTLESISDFPALKILSHIEIRSTAQGQLQMHGPSLLTGFALLRRERNRDTFIDPKVDGWFTSEDRGEVRSGFLLPQGRALDFVKIGGESVDLTRLSSVFERLKMELNLETDIVITSIADPRLGHSIAVFYAGSPPIQCPPEVERLIEKFNESVAPFEKIRQIYQVPLIPRSALQKVLKAELLALASNPRNQNNGS